MVFGSSELREAVLRARIERAESLIAALTEALFKATGTVVCEDCYAPKRTEHCPRCRGIEGERKAAPSG
jgi:recombinational DNA repair protein RecR